VICSSLVLSAYYYRLQYQRALRYTSLRDNLGSAINILIAGADTSYTKKAFSLFGMENDSVIINRIAWGAYDVATTQAFIQRDTLYKTFYLAYAVDSTKWGVLYLADNQRPLSLSGKTSIIGDAFLSPAGVNQAYVNNQAYSGDKKLISGHIRKSAQQLPALNTVRLQKLQNLILSGEGIDTSLIRSDSITNSFLSPVKTIRYGKRTATISHKNISGNVVILSDTSLTIDSTVVLNHTLIYAQSVNVKSGFRGNCQIFVKDTIGIGQNSYFDYPSCIGVIRFQGKALVKTQARINFQNGCTFSGLVFTYEAANQANPPLIAMGKKVKIQGMVYSQGILKLQDNAEVDGMLMVNRFLYQTNYTQYENYIVNAQLNEQALSHYYLSSSIVPVVSNKRKILQWLEGN
jgi:hypothetical protein